VQTCIVHLIRSSLRYVNYKDRKKVASALRPIYCAANADDALHELDRFEALKGGPRGREFAAGREVDLPLVRDYVRMREAEARKSGNAEDKAWVDNNNLVERYDRTISEVLDRRQELIEKDLLRQSSVLQDHPISDPKTRWLDRLSR